MNNHNAGRSFWKREVSALNGKDFLAPALKRSPEPYSVRRGNTALIFMDTSNHYEFVTPDEFVTLAPYPVRSKLRRKSGIVRNFWIPAGVYPDENRGRNDILRGSLIYFFACL